MIDRERHRDRMRVLRRAKRYQAGRAAQAELRRMGREPGRVLDAEQRLRQARAEGAN